MGASRFSELAYARPDMGVVDRAYDDLVSRQAAIESSQAQIALVEEWQRLLRELRTAEALALIRFHKDTGDAAAREEKAFFDGHLPHLQGRYVELASLLIASPHRDVLEGIWGPQLFVKLASYVASQDPRTEALMAEEAALTTRYEELIAGAKIELDGEVRNIPQILRYQMAPDRSVRREACEAKFGFFGEHAEELDEIFDAQVACRHRMALELGRASFTEVAYARMGRTDYGPDEVARFREAVVEHILPLAANVYARQTARLGLPALQFHDELIHDVEGNPEPQGDDEWVLQQARAMFDDMGDETGRFFRMMLDRELVDVSARAGKSGGGFATLIPDHGVPFIFGNFNGTQNDVRLLIHEGGHAFAFHLASDQPLLEYVYPTPEACEIHSMAMELLSWPYMERFFGREADRYRRNHLVRSLLLFPGICLGDHFQHWVYDNPDATPAERHAQWMTLERTYLPHRDYAGLPWVSDRGLWQTAVHFFRIPFYFVDYALAQTAALQLWDRGMDDPRGTFDVYVSLCRLGGSRSYLSLLEHAGLDSPFHEETIARLAGTARRWLGV